MDTFQALDAEQVALSNRTQAQQTALTKRIRDALQAERDKLATERKALEAERSALRAEKAKFAADLEKEKAALMEQVAERERKHASVLAEFEQQRKEAEARYRDPSNIVQLNVTLPIDWA
jgi:hypothetical protein